MAAKTVKDSANWASIWVKEVEVTSADVAVGTMVTVGAKTGITIDTPRTGEDGKFYATIDTAALVRVSGVSGTATDGATVLLTGAGAVTLTVATNKPIGYLDRAKVATGDDLWLQLVPGLSIGPAAA